jgi:hypothetical protein
MDLARQRLVQQRLVGEPHERAEQVVASLLAVQAQDYAGAKWAIAQRTASAADAEVEQAYRAGSILRTHVLRPTWHFVSPADIRWLLELTAPRVHAANAYAYRLHGMDTATVKRSNARIAKALGRGQHLTRAELGRALGEPDVEAKGNRLAYLVMRAELDGLIGSGVPRGKQHTYALLEERAPPAPKRRRDEAFAELARRYVSGHGPAQARDLAWWSGLTIAHAGRAFEACGSTLERVSIEGVTYWCLPGAAAVRSRGPVVHLLPSYDELLVAFKDRSAMLDVALVPGRSVLFTPVVTVDGRIVGSWRRSFAPSAAPSEVVILAQLLRPLTGAESRGLDRAAARYARSLGLPFRLTSDVV